jgi:hypothetical protein
MAIKYNGEEFRIPLPVPVPEDIAENAGCQLDFSISCFCFVLISFGLSLPRPANRQWFAQECHANQGLGLGVQWRYRHGCRDL